MNILIDVLFRVAFDASVAIVRSLFFGHKPHDASAATPRPRATSEIAIRAHAAAYDDWARSRGLRPVEGSVTKHQGSIDGREILFDGGASGSAAREPEIRISTALLLDAPLRIDREYEGEGELAALARAILEEDELVRYVGFAHDHVSVVFFVSSHPEAFDLALFVLDRELRGPAAPIAPYR